MTWFGSGAGHDLKHKADVSRRMCQGLYLYHQSKRPLECVSKTKRTPARHRQRSDKGTGNKAPDRRAEYLSEIKFVVVIRGIWKAAPSSELKSWPAKLGHRKVGKCRQDFSSPRSGQKWLGIKAHCCCTLLLVELGSETAYSIQPAEKHAFDHT